MCDYFVICNTSFGPTWGEKVDLKNSFCKANWRRGKTPPVQWSVYYIKPYETKNFITLWRPSFVFVRSSIFMDLGALPLARYGSVIFFWSAWTKWTTFGLRFIRSAMQPRKLLGWSWNQSRQRGPLKIYMQCECVWCIKLQRRKDLACWTMLNDAHGLGIFEWSCVHAAIFFSRELGDPWKHQIESQILKDSMHTGCANSHVVTRVVYHEACEHHGSSPCDVRPGSHCLQPSENSLNKTMK